MKGYLVLENGILFQGEIISKTKNILGNIVFDKQGTIKLQCQKTGKYGLIVNDLNDASGDILLADMDFQNLKQMLEKDNKLQGKIVIDSLPIEYHVYDLKTFIPA